MKCLKCGNKWKRKKILEYISFLSKCPDCGSRKIIRNDLIKFIFKKIIGLNNDL